AVLREVVHRPAQEGARRSNLSTCDCRSCSLHECTHVIVARHCIYLSSEPSAQLVRMLRSNSRYSQAARTFADCYRPLFGYDHPQLTPFHIGNGGRLERSGFGWLCAPPPAHRIHEALDTGAEWWAQRAGFTACQLHFQTLPASWRKSVPRGLFLGHKSIALHCPSWPTQASVRSSTVTAVRTGLIGRHINRSCPTAGMICAHSHNV